MDFDLYKGPDLPPYKYEGSGSIEGNPTPIEPIFTFILYHQTLILFSLVSLIPTLVSPIPSLCFPNPLLP